MFRIVFDAMSGVKKLPKCLPEITQTVSTNQASFIEVTQQTLTLKNSKPEGEVTQQTLTLKNSKPEGEVTQQTLTLKNSKPEGEVTQQTLTLKNSKPEGGEPVQVNPFERPCSSYLFSCSFLFSLLVLFHP